MLISRTSRSCTQHLKVFETYHADAAIADDWYVMGFLLPGKTPDYETLAVRFDARIASIN